MLKSWLSKPARVVPVSSTPPKGDEGTCRPIPGKRKRDDHDVDDAENVPASKRTFIKSLNQGSFEWYKKDKKGLWHCTLCRGAKMDNGYAKGREKAAKTTNHARHSLCKYQ